MRPRSTRNGRLAATVVAVFMLVACGEAARGGAPAASPTSAGAPAFAIGAATPPTPTATPLPTPSARPTALTTTTSIAFGTPPPASCPVTRPQTPAFVPPAPHCPTPSPLYTNRFWYGSAELWTWLPADGTWQILRDKSFWWRQGYHYSDEPRPDLTLSGRRLDEVSPPFATHGPATHGFRDDIGIFMLTMVDLPTPGCWEITGRYKEAAELVFVVWIAPLSPR